MREREWQLNAKRLLLAVSLGMPVGVPATVSATLDYRRAVSLLVNIGR